ncbi:hypothetical protein INT47_011894 [Mucor saturninus]|uniref:U three protein 23 n=1 Tax=Mucor saturninus TaxID=64648 RepID=A0A8H7QSL9_9FUNG|nr:hypothetical protein INT47_011894 [Mucor saturninus]
MSPKSHRSNKKIVHAYSVGFGFRPPYQILLDGDFCKAALEKQIYIKDELPVLMTGLTRLVVTDCILQDIKGRGHDFTSAFILAKRFETRRCPHKEKVVSSYDCIRDLVGAENHQHFCVATQNPKLKDRMRKIPGVPLIYVNVKGNGLGLEPMTEKSKEMVKLNEIEKVKPLDKETARLKRALYSNEEEQVHEPKPTPKKRKVKGVNPLAMKKKKKKAPPPPKKKPVEKKAAE